MWRSRLYYVRLISYIILNQKPCSDRAIEIFIPQQKPNPNVGIQ